MRTRAAGLADAEVLGVNRDKVDPAEVNKAADTRALARLRGSRNAGAEQPLHGPEVTLVVEQEKVIGSAGETLKLGDLKTEPRESSTES